MYTLAASKGAVRAGVRRALQRGALADRLRAMSEPVFTLQHTDGAARAGLLRTAHGVIPTPIFMPVGTVGSVKAIAPDDLAAIGAPIILGNTYHLYLRPGDELVARHGGLHGFASWPGAVLTDSGGFQVFSLSSLRKIREEGVEFRSHLDGSRHLFTPEKVISIQRNLNSDIMMVLDECVPYGADYAYTETSLALTTRWAARARAAYPAGTGSNLLSASPGGFLQGSALSLGGGNLRPGFRRLRHRRPVRGRGQGGNVRPALPYGPLLPSHKPRYLMGVGTPLDIAHGIHAGVDMFDCVLPTRNARNGTLYTSLGKVNIKRKEYAEDDGPLDPACGCYTCRTFSRAYLRHLYVSKELLSFRLNSLHNLTYFLRLAREARQAVLENRFGAFLAGMEALYPEEAAQAAGV